MQYILLIYGDQSSAESMSKDDMDTMMTEYGAYTGEIQQSGAMVAGEALHPTSTATTVKVRDGKTVTTDGPFAETKEQLGGYYVVEAPDLAAAIELAARCPGAKYGSVEVRPIMVFE
ncbi:MAG: YciI family protein [Dehalococcoidia bacterium]